jgi:hypothetical protein
MVRRITSSCSWGRLFLIFLLLPLSLCAALVLPFLQLLLCVLILLVFIELKVRVLAMPFGNARLTGNL